MFKRIAIIGNSCSGKTRLSLALGRTISAPVTHIDQLQFNGDLSLRPYQDTIADLKALQSEPSWLIDGYGPLDILQERFKEADLIVLLDWPVYKNYFWAIKRILFLCFKPRDEMPIGANELNYHHLKKLFSSIQKHQKLMRPELLRILAKPEFALKTKIVRSKIELMALHELFLTNGKNPANTE